MAMAVRYTNFDGRLLHENRGGTIAPYVPDTLGSVAAVLPSGSLSPFQATYWPYGEVNTSSGTNPSPWAFVGTLGYYVDIVSLSTYVRARIYKPATAQWLILDPLWPEQSAYPYSARPATIDGGEQPYGYTMNNPLAWTDPSGKIPFCIPGHHRFYDPCSSCAAAILYEWFPQPAHRANHQYAHCMACCVLTKLAGPDCAWDNQFEQNLIDVYPFKGRVGRIGARFDLCSEGIAIGITPTPSPMTNFGHCDKECQKLHPMPIRAGPIRPGERGGPIPASGKPVKGFPFLPDCEYAQPWRH